MAYCSECGAQHEGARFCANCGASLAESASSVVAPSPTISDDDDEQIVWEGSPDHMLSPVDKRTTHYVVTTERIKVDRGALRKRIETIELYRVKDVKIKKSVAQRARKKGDVVILSVDPTAPELVFESVDAPDELAETIRSLVKKARKASGVTAREDI